MYGGGGGSGSTTVLRSPLAGTVVERHATAGEIATPESQLFVIADIDPVWVVGRAYETDLARLRLGAPALVRVKAYRDRTWEGHIDYVSPTLVERTRTAEVRVELDNPDGALKPGMFATIASAAQSTESEASLTLAVPVGAVQRDGSETIVFVQKSAGRFERRVVVLGIRGTDFIEVDEGLNESESVVVEGAFILKSEAEKHQMGSGHHH
jgi:RND family efflux transporter MFP subunit